MSTDQIADLFTRMRNAGMAKHSVVKVPASKTKESILKLLQKEGYIEDFKVEKIDEVKSEFKISLNYDENGNHVIREIKRISTPGRRIYVGADEVKEFKSNLGVYILSSSSGMVTDKEAREQRVAYQYSPT